MLKKSSFYTPPLKIKKGELQKLRPLDFISGSATDGNYVDAIDLLNYSNLVLFANQLASIRSLTSEFLTSAEAADYLGISVESLRNMTSNGNVPFYKLPGTRSNRYLVKELRELLLRSRKGGFHGN
jgi:excisionase family DNA binding protein